MNLIGGFGIEIAGRFIGQHQPRTQHHRARDRNPLLLATRKLRRPAMKLVGDPTKASISPAPRDFLSVFARSARHHHVLKRGEVGKQIVELEDKTKLQIAKFRELRAHRAQTNPALRNRPARRSAAPGSQHVEQSGFADPGLSDDGNRSAANVTSNPAPRRTRISRPASKKFLTSPRLRSARRRRCAARLQAARSFIADDLDRRQRAGLQGRDRASAHAQGDR